MWCLLKSCRICGGDLVLDGDEWRCWQCGRYYYPVASLLELPEEPPVPGSMPAGERGPGEGRARRLARRAPRNVNSRILSRDRSDRRWWQRNQEVIRYLEEGRSVREISRLVSKGERQVRVVREQLKDLRAA